MKENTKQLLIGLGIGAGILVVGGAIYYFMNKNKSTTDGDKEKEQVIEGGRSIIIGDSQTPFIKKQSSKKPHNTNIIKPISNNVLFFFIAKYIKAVKNNGIAKTSA